MTITVEFDDGNNSYTVKNADDDYELNFKKGEDFLTVTATGAVVTAYMGDDDDWIYVDAPGAQIHGYLGSGDDNVALDAVGFAQIYGGPGMDRFEINQNANVLLDGGSDHDRFYGHHNVITGNIFGGPGRDYFEDFENCDVNLSLYGGTGNDIFTVGGSSSPNIVEYADQGEDTIHLVAPVSYVMAENV